MDSTQAKLQVLAARLERLETSNRRWKFVNVLLLLSAVSLVLMGAKPADRIDPEAVRARSVEAQEFMLKDPEGRVCARLALTPGMKQLSGHVYIMPSQGIRGRATLEFYDEKGEVIWTAPTSPTLIPVK